MQELFFARTHDFYSSYTEHCHVLHAGAACVSRSPPTRCMGMLHCLYLIVIHKYKKGWRFQYGCSQTSYPPSHRNKPSHFMLIVSPLDLFIEEISQDLRDTFTSTRSSVILWMCTDQTVSNWSASLIQDPSDGWPIMVSFSQQVTSWEYYIWKSSVFYSAK